MQQLAVCIAVHYGDFIHQQSGGVMIQTFPPTDERSL